MSESKTTAKPAPRSCPIDHGLSANNYTQRWDLLDSADKLRPHPGDSSRDLATAGKTAWRNSTRCIGRSLWKTLQVVDARQVGSPDDLFEALLTHLQESTNNGRIRSMMTVFPAWHPEQPEIRIWNHQLLRYAGYTLANGSTLGDPMNKVLTQVAQSLGWKPPKERGAFDLLPIIIQMGDELKWYTLPPADVLEVTIRHPEYAGIEGLGLRWYANPIISDMIFATGAEVHGCAPFNGHYMLTEIAARNFADIDRYNMLPQVAAGIGLRDSPSNPLWKDRALVTLAEAVLWSFKEAGVSIVDHHRASQHFSKFCEHSKTKDNEVQADWDWIVPPMSGSTTPVFHESYSCQTAFPNFLMQQVPWETERGQALLMAKRVRV